ECRHIGKDVRLDESSEARTLTSPGAFDPPRSGLGMGQASVALRFARELQPGIAASRLRLGYSTDGSTCSPSESPKRLPTVSLSRSPSCWVATCHDAPQQSGRANCGDARLPPTAVGWRGYRA